MAAPTRLLTAALLAAALVTFGATRSASACHDDECRPEASPVSLGFIAADVVLLGIDATYALDDKRPGRLYGGAEVALGLIQYPIALGLVLDEGHDYADWAGVQVVAASVVVLHGTYVLIRGGKSAPSERKVSFAPHATAESAGVTVFGRF